MLSVTNTGAFPFPNSFYTLFLRYTQTKNLYIYFTNIWMIINYLNKI